ncbi:TonB-dependent receptor [Lysobacter maris]|uniref:TonB-dependent receptor n=2 Tax=Marilutibacter maris TaxID=1605891 RepID=A0A507ZTQ5_9GAMM|nr:TonB-dependent receptor [Lysobacter maris]
MKTAVRDRSTDSIRKGALSCAIATALMSATPMVSAQEVEPPSESEEVTSLEKMVVVGTRIRRKDEVAASPVFTMERAEIEATAAVSVGELLQELPSVGSSFNSTGSGGTSHGSSTVNLRNLGANRVLVLVNGRRWVNGAGTRGFRDFVDLNTIPLVAVERVEVLLDGATALYGADAIAGVVNLITYRDFDGVKASSYAGQTTHGDGFTYSQDFLWGTQGEWGSALVSATIASNEEVLAGARDFSFARLQGPSRNTPAGRFRNGVDTGAFGTDAFVPDGNGGFRPNSPDVDVHNEAPDTTLLGPLDRQGVYGQLRLNLGDYTTLVAEGLYNHRESSQRFSPSAPRIRGGDGMSIPADHPYNPFGVEFAGAGTDFEIVRQLDAVGPRINRQEVGTTRFAIGVEGSLANGWAWNAFYTYARNRATWNSLNQIDLDKLALAIGPNDRCQANGCVPLDIFGEVTPEMADYIRANGTDRNGTRQHDFTANITGDLFEMPAGPLAFAAGIEYRKESGYDRPSAYFSRTPQFISYSRITTSAPRLPTSGSYDLKEAYLELNVPLLKERPLANLLELSAATRYSDYNTFGSTTNSKLGLVWRPWKDLMVRATWAEGFRAPSINELFAGLRQTNLPANDPCNGGGAGKPGCAGVPADYDQANFSGGAIPSTVGGNPDLQPETSENRSIGFVYTPSFAERLSWSVDGYDIRIDEAISSFGSQNLLNLCANTGQRCGSIRRASSGEIVNLTDGPINLNSLRAKGVDTTLRYLLPNPGWGSFGMTFSASYLDTFDRFDTLPSGEIRTAHRAGRSDVARESFPRWKAGTSLDWSRDGWKANWSMRYIGATDEGPEPAFGRIPAQLTHDLWGSYTILSGTATFTLGVENLFDKDPPRSYVNGRDLNFDMSTYNPRGRFVYLKASFLF